MGIPMDIQIHAWIPFEVCLIAYGGLHEDPDGDPHGVSAWTMGFPEEMAMEIPVGIPIPMQIHTHGDSIPAEMRRGRLGHGAAQGAGPALAPSSPRGNPADLQPNPKGIHVEILFTMWISIGIPVEISVVCACVGGGGGGWWWWCVCVAKEMYVYGAY